MEAKCAVNRFPRSKSLRSSDQVLPSVARCSAQERNSGLERAVCPVVPSLGVTSTRWAVPYAPLLLSENVPEVPVNPEGFHLEKVNAFINLPLPSAAVGLLPGAPLNKPAEGLELLLF